MDPYYWMDVSAAAEPLKEFLQRIAVNDDDAEIVEEALPLPEAYTIPGNNIGDVAERFMTDIMSLLKKRITVRGIIDG